MSAATMLSAGCLGPRTAAPPSQTSASCSLRSRGADAFLPRAQRQNAPLWLGQHAAQKKRRARTRAISASSTGGRELYQPFRRPPTTAPPPTAPADGGATVVEQLQTLKERQGLWFAYATVIPTLTRAGFTPSEIEEATGLTGHEQNQLVVGAQVRDSLVASGLAPDAVAWFDVGGEGLLYELRTLSAAERKSAAEFVIDRNMDAKLVRDLARAVKDFPRRKRTEGFASFSAAPGDCLAFALYRQSKETSNEAEIEAILTRAAEFAVTKKATAKILHTLGRGVDELVEEEQGPPVTVLVMRLSSEKIPVVLPIVGFSAEEMENAPARPVAASGSSGDFNVMKTETPWNSWIAIPTCKPITEGAAPVAVLVPDGAVLPKHTGIELVNGRPILVVVDKGSREVGNDSFYVVVSPEGGLTLQPGSRISANQPILGKVLMALKPPLPHDPGMDSEWDY